MATANVYQGDTNVVGGITSPIDASSYDITVVFNFPSPEVDTSQYDSTTLTTSDIPLNVSQFDLEAVFRGSIYNPRLRAWSFDLDSHEFYVLRLGNSKTLIYDLSTEQWSWWSGSDVTWRAQIGTNWTSSGAIPAAYGSNVIVGDDTFGILWVLDPEQGYDEASIEAQRDEGVTIKYPRVATGQLTTRGRITIPCYQVYLVSDAGYPSYEGATVTLSYSDDGGNTFVSAGTRTVESGNYYQEFAWRSLGLIRSPGRLFRIEDDGAFAQINELTVYDNSAA